jgi:hypothetical protein
VSDWTRRLSETKECCYDYSARFFWRSCLDKQLRTSNVWAKGEKVSKQIWFLPSSAKADKAFCLSTVSTAFVKKRQKETKKKLDCVRACVCVIWTGRYSVKIPFSHFLFSVNYFAMFPASRRLGWLMNSKAFRRAQSRLNRCASQTFHLEGQNKIKILCVPAGI